MGALSVCGFYGKGVFLPQVDGGMAVAGFGDSSAQRVVTVFGGAVFVFDSDELVVAVPVVVCNFAVMGFAGQIAALVVFVVCAGIGFQQVAPYGVGSRGYGGASGCFGGIIQTVAGGVEGEGFVCLRGNGGNQSAYRIIAVFVLAGGTVDMGKLPGRVVTVIASAAVVGLLQDSADGVVAGLLYVVFAEAAFGCAVQPVAFVSGDFPLVEGNAVQMAAAVLLLNVFRKTFDVYCVCRGH